ncbi:anaphase-promoting complex subunit 7-like isoform X4 [Miscanthus floridulus]|uniref:anaphase-promoting complex subunit 7-like isoform X4 n=1 Tax=Miscanthus floridulus TaxID=154761 RepID=UPI0034575724
MKSRGFGVRTAHRWSEGTSQNRGGRRAAEQQGVVAADVWRCSTGTSEPRPRLCVLVVAVNGGSTSDEAAADLGFAAWYGRGCTRRRRRGRRNAGVHDPDCVGAGVQGLATCGGLGCVGRRRRGRRARPRLCGSQCARAGGGVRTRLQRRHGWERPRLYGHRRAGPGLAAASERVRRRSVGGVGHGEAGARQFWVCGRLRAVRGGLDIYLELMQRFPNNVHILLEIAKVEAIIGRNDEVIMNFEKARLIDPNIMTYMDEYAILLKSKSDYIKLNKLVHDMLHIDPARPETCVALAAMWERKDERKALTYAEKSLRVDDRHITGYIMKGNLHLSLNRPDLAVTDFRGAQELRADLRSYQGLVRAYLALSKCKEALFTAREAMKVLHQSAKALKLVGDVHAISSSGREKTSVQDQQQIIQQRILLRQARKFYESAIRLEPGFLGAALALADLHVVEGRNKEAVMLLEKYLRQWADDSLHIKLAQVHAATNMLSDALSHYQSALRINPQNEAAKNGLERLEKQMKGVDPDAPEEEEENEDDIDDRDEFI